MIKLIAICSGCKFGRQDRKLKDIVKTFKHTFCVTVSSLVFIICVILLGFIITVIV